VKGRGKFYADYFKPFIKRYAHAIRSVAPGAIIFVQGVRSQGELTWDATDAQIVHAALVRWNDLDESRLSPG
jgi:hypothetical protein